MIDPSITDGVVVGRSFGERGRDPEKRKEAEWNDEK